VLEGWATGRCGQAFYQIAVLGGVGYAVQGPKHLATGPAGVRGLGFGKCIGIAHYHGVEGGVGAGAIVGVHAGQVGLDQFDRRRAARLERAAQLGDGNLGYLDHAFTRKCRLS